MQRERVTDDVYVFTSELYAQVTASIVLTSEGAVLFDTLAYPTETHLIRQFVNERLGVPVRYVVNSHFHADHSLGTYLFSGAKVIAHDRCRELLNDRGRVSLEKMKSVAAEMREVELVLPDLCIGDNGTLNLHIGNKTLKFWSTPGHSPDSIVCLVEEDAVLLAADTVLPLPHFVDDRYDNLLSSLKRLADDGYECIIQGHGEVVLSGEVKAKLTSDIDYLVSLKEAVEEALRADVPDKALDAIDVEHCGKSRILLNGDVELLHRQNVQQLAKMMRDLPTMQA